ncbi:MAG: hypothetical protein V3V01_04395 [Acidimicrobiales bacterium]
MTDSDPSLPDDELVSAYLDGEATVDEVARVEADPELLRQVEAFRAVASLTAAAPARPDDYAATRERAINAALAASSTTPKVTSLAPVQARRSRFSKPMLGVLSAAAVILVFFLGAAIVGNLGGGDDADTAASSADFDVTSDGAGDAADDSDDSGGADGTVLTEATAEQAPEAPGDAAESSMDEPDDNESADDAGDDDAMADSESAEEDDADEAEEADESQSLERFASVDDIVDSFTARTKAAPAETLAPAFRSTFSVSQGNRFDACAGGSSDFEDLLFLEEVLLKTTSGDEVPVFVFFDVGTPEQPIKLLDTLGCFELP